MKKSEIHHRNFLKLHEWAKIEYPCKMHLRISFNFEDDRLEIIESFLALRRTVIAVYEKPDLLDANFDVSQLKLISNGIHI